MASSDSSGYRSRSQVVARRPTSAISPEFHKGGSAEYRSLSIARMRATRSGARSPTVLATRSSGDRDSRCPTFPMYATTARLYCSSITALILAWRRQETHAHAADSALTCCDAVVVMRAVVRSDHLPIHARAEFRTDLLVARGLGGDVVGEGARYGAQPGSRRRHRQGFGELRWLDLAGARRRTYATGPMPLSSMARRR